MALVAISRKTERKAKALIAFRKTGTVVHACNIAGISRRTWYDWIESDPGFAAAVRDVDEAVIDDLEKEAIQRAKDGSDSLIMFLLKSKRPQVYRETQRIEVVSPQVRENLRSTCEVIVNACDRETAERVLTQLDEIWAPRSLAIA